jgi:hypothetical protein
MSPGSRLAPTAALAAGLALVLAACTTDVEVDSPFEDEEATEGASVTTPLALTGCRGHADSAIPADDTYVITTFGGPGDHQPMSCGGRADGTWYYAASRQRYGCGARIAIRGNGRCVVAQTDDYGPDVCVERAVARPIMDVSPAVARALFGSSSFGWSDRVTVTVEEVARSTPLGPCATTSEPPPGTPPPPPPAPPALCHSATLDRDVAAGTCVRPASGTLYGCVDGAWVARSSTTGCAALYEWCQSATLGRGVPARTCVQAASNGAWYQCNGSGWVRPASASEGPIGACSTSYPL